jgi:hypothetical protein
MIDDNDGTTKDDRTIYRETMIRGMTQATMRVRRWDEDLPMRVGHIHRECTTMISRSDLLVYDKERLYDETLANIEYAIHGSDESAGDVLARLGDELICVYNGTSEVPVL